MKKFFGIFIFVILITAFISPALCQEKLWNDLQEKAITLYQQKQHEEAVETEEKALMVAEETFGPNDLKVAESLDNLAIYYQALDNYKEAEGLYRRALAIMEKNLSPYDHYLAIFMDYLSDFYAKVGNNIEAERLRNRAKAIRGKKI